MLKKHMMCRQAIQKASDKNVKTRPNQPIWLSSGVVFMTSKRQQLKQK